MKKAINLGAALIAEQLNATSQLTQTAIECHWAFKNGPGKWNELTVSTSVQHLLKAQPVKTFDNCSDHNAAKPGGSSMRAAAIPFDSKI